MKGASADLSVCKTLLREDGTVEVLSIEPVPAGQHVPPDMGEMIAAEQALLNDPEFKRIIATLDLPPNAKVVADGWIFGEYFRKESVNS